MSESSKHAALYNIVMCLIPFVPTMCLSTVACFAIVYRIAWLAVAAIAGAVLTVPKFSVSTGGIDVK